MITQTWLEERLYDIDMIWYQGLIGHEERAERKHALGELYTDHVNRQAVLEWRRANSKAYGGIAQFYGATWTPDRDGGIFRKDSLDLTRLERSPNLLLRHNPGHRLGRIEDVAMDCHGAFCTTKFDLKSSEGRAWRTVVRERLGRAKNVYASVGIAKGSRGYVARHANGLELKTFTHVPVEEFSIVPYPSQPRAEFLSCT